MGFPTVRLWLSRDRIESISEIDSQKSEGRHEDPKTQTCGSLKFEWLKIAEPVIGGSSLEEGQGIDGRCLFEGDREPQLEGILVVDGRAVTIHCRSWGTILGNQRLVWISPHGHIFASVHAEGSHTVSPEIESFKRRNAPVTVVSS